MKTARQSIAVLAVIVAVTLSGCSAGSGTVEPTATPALALQGRMLWLVPGENATFAIVENRLDTMAMGTLVEGIPYAAGTYASRPRGVFSRDGKALLVYAEDPAKVAVVDIPSGNIRQLPLPGITDLGYNGLWGAFSPDGSYLAYALTGYEGLTHSGLYLFDLETGVTSTLYEAPCADYMMGGEVCGAVLEPTWLDETTLVFSGYKGEMPDQIEGYSSALNYFTPSIPEPNRSFVVTVQGVILQEYEPVLGDSLHVQGEILEAVRYSDETNDCLQKCFEEDVSTTTATPEAADCADDCLVEYRWFALDDVRQGAVGSDPMSVTANTLSSPDSRFLLSYVGRAWHLIAVSEGSDRIVEHLAQMCGDTIRMWSPDGGSVVCSDPETYNLKVVSLESASSRSLLIGSSGLSLLLWVP